jgi:hypothetical protein
MAKDRRSRDQKRKAKLTERARKQTANEPLAYSGRKYQAPKWVPYVYQTERAIYETILLANRRLLNEQVEAALVQLISYLRAHHPPLLAADAPEVVFAAGHEIDYLVWNIRRHWQLAIDEAGPIDPKDLVGILRTLLHSIEAHAWHRGPERGYVSFLQDFMAKVPIY